MFNKSQMIPVLVPDLISAERVGSALKHTSPQKGDKTIEIVTVPRLVDQTTDQDNVGIDFDEGLILDILCKHYHNVKITEILSFHDLESLTARRPDLVFSGVKYFHFNGKELWLNDYLDLHDIAYIASNKNALDSEHDKAGAKDIMQKTGVTTASYFTIRLDERLSDISIPIAFPLFVKPIAGGDSKGVDANSVVDNFISFQAKVAEIHQSQKSHALVETYLSGKEYSVGIFEDSVNGSLTAMPVEIIVDENGNGHRILDFDIKKNDCEKVVAVTDGNIHQGLSDLAKTAFKALGGKSLGRIDIKMNHNNIPHFMEANLMPGLREGYFYRACAINLNMSYEEMILKIASNGLLS